MKCSHVFSDTGDTLLTCNRPANLDDGRPACDEHATPRGWVYVMAWGEYVKIGFSQDPLVRLAQLGSDRAGAIMPPDQPGTVTLLGAVPGSIATEQLIHAALDDARTVGEWFRRTSHVDRVVSYIETKGTFPVPRRTSAVEPVRVTKMMDF